MAWNSGQAHPIVSTHAQKKEKRKKQTKEPEIRPWVSHFQTRVIVVPIDPMNKSVDWDQEEGGSKPEPSPLATQLTPLQVFRFPFAFWFRFGLATRIEKSRFVGLAGLGHEAFVAAWAWAVF